MKSKEKARASKGKYAGDAGRMMWDEEIMVLDPQDKRELSRLYRVAYMYGWPLPVVKDGEVTFLSPVTD